MATSDAAQIRAHLLYLHPEGPWVIGVKTKGIAATAFDDVDRATAHAAAESEKPNVSAVYVALQRCRPGIFQKNSLADGDIAELTNLLIDLDRAEAVEQNASREELASLEQAADCAFHYLRSVAETSVLESRTGNGCALYVPLTPLENNPTNIALLRDALHGLAAHLQPIFAEHSWRAEVDLSVFNPGRWTRLAGTINRKYPESEGRPHRLSALRFADVRRNPAKETFLNSLAQLAPASSSTKKNVELPAEIKTGSRNVTLFRLGSLFRRFGAAESVIAEYLLAQNQAVCNPPLSDRDVRVIAAQCAKYKPVQITKETLTETWAAEQFAERYADRLRYVHDLAEWRLWDSVRWATDENGCVHRYVKDFIRELSRLALTIEDEDRRRQLITFACRLESRQKREAVVALARAEKPVAARSSDFDRGNWLLNCKNGTLDLKTRELREHRREDLITRLANVSFDATADCEPWTIYLEQVFPNKPDVIKFLQRAAGYSLFGGNPDECFFLLQGDGGNGKGTFLQTLSEILGSYATNVEFSVFISKPFGDSGPRDGKLKLLGRRFVRSSEADHGQRLNESKIKDITSPDGKKISAGVFYKEDIDFEPTHKLWLATNPELTIRGTDSGIWRRIRRINFEQNFRSKPDTSLKERLLQDSVKSGILNWALDGLREYVVAGRLENAPEVEQATAEYRESQDQTARFLAAANDPQATLDCRIVATDLYELYKTWTARNREYTLTSKQFGIEIKRHLQWKKTNSGICYFGFRRKLEIVEPEDVGTIC